MTDPSSEPLLPAAVLWDMDGTLVDTEPIWQRSQVELTGRFGVEWTHEDGLVMVGSALERSGEYIQAKGVDMGVEEIVEWMTSYVMERLATGDLPWRPGARELLDELHDRGVPTALVTMSRRRMALVTAAALGDRGFDVVVAGDDVERPKPHPDPYLMAADRLGLDVTACVAIEDSATGVASAAASGAVTIGVEHLVPLADSAADVHLTTLAGVDLERLVALTSPALAARARRSLDERPGGTVPVAQTAPTPDGGAA